MKYSILGCGFIGTNLAIQLLSTLKENDKLQIVDRSFKNDISTFINTAKERGVIVKLHKMEGAEFLKEINSDTLSFFEDAIVYNLMAIVGVKNWSKDQFKTYQNNKRIDDMLVPFLPLTKKYIYASTSEVYGSLLPNEENFSEKSEFRIMNYDSNGRGLYALEKIQGEITSKFSGNYVNVRLFNIIGKYQEISKGVFANFYHKLKKNEPIQASADIRCFCDVRDCVNALIILGNNEFVGNINISNEANVFDMNSLAYNMRTYLKSKSAVKELGTGGISKRIGNNTLMRKFYTPIYTLEDTIKSMES